MRLRVALILALICSLAQQGLAFDVRSGNTTNIPSGATINDDLLAAGQSIDVAGRVTGNSLLAGNQVTSTGPVTGFLAAAGSSVNLSGPKGTVAAAGANVDLKGTTALNAALAGQSVTVDRNSRFTRDLYASGQTVDVRGNVGRNLKSAASKVTIGGTITGNVDASGESITLEPGTLIKGNFIYHSPNRAKFGDGAKVLGSTIYRPMQERQHRAHSPFASLIGFIPVLLLGLLFIALFPRWSAETAGRIVAAPGWSVLWGLIVLIVAPIAAGIAFVTLIGIPIGFVILFAYFIALMLTAIFVSLAIGALALKGRTIWIQFLAGLVIIFLLGLIPFLGSIVWFAVILFGLGAIWVNLIRRPSAMPA